LHGHNGQVRQNDLKATSKQKAKFEKYTMKREAPKEEAVEAMDAHADSTMNKKRKFS